MNIAIFGASGAIGGALVDHYLHLGEHTIFALSRKPITSLHPQVHHLSIDYTQEETLRLSAENISHQTKLDRIIVATGFLHDTNHEPEKSLQHISSDAYEKNFLINCIAPMMVLKYFSPLMQKNSTSIFAALSARVGSISDNRLGGWYAYRSAKAALNMSLKTASIEMARKNKEAIIVGLHPGTVDSALSKPFQKNVVEGKLFSPDLAAEKLVGVIESLTIKNSGHVLAWDGSKIPS